MSAYFQAPARPVLAVPDAIQLRAEPSVLLRTGMLAVIEDPALFNVLAKYDETSLAVDDGTRVWKPDDLGVLDPGRWLVFGAESGGAHTYVKRKSDGSIDGLTADFSSPVARVNYGIGANDPVPAVLCGLSVDRGAVAGVERDRATLLWDEATQTWHAAFSTTADTVLSTRIPIVVGGVRSASGGASGFVRLNQDEAITAKVGATTYNLAKATAAGIAAFGDSNIDQATLDANNDVTLTSRANEINAHGSHFRVRDPSGLNETLDVLPGTYAKVTGNLSAYSGATRIFEVLSASARAELVGALRFFDTLLAGSSDITSGSAPQTLDAVPVTVATIAVPASGSVTVFSYAKGVESTGANGFSQIAVNSARRNGAAAPTLSQGLTGLVLVTLENTFAVVRPSVQFVISGNNLLIQVVGKAATTINWVPVHWTISR